MTSQMIAVDANALDTLIHEVKSLRAEVKAARIQPDPEWITVPEMARMVGKSESTINRWINDGKLETRMVAKVKMVKVQGHRQSN